MCASVLVLLAAPWTVVSGGEDDASRSIGSHFYDHREEGWFFYHDPVAEEDPEDEEEVAEPEEQEPEFEPVQPLDPEPSEVATPEPEPKPEQPAEQDPEPYSVEWLREEIDEAVDEAVADPSEENIKRFLALQQIAAAQAHQFSERVEQIGRQYPELSPDPSAARTEPALGARADRAGEYQQQIIDELSDSAALWVFHDGNVIAQTQQPVLESFLDRYDYDIEEVTPPDVDPVSEKTAHRVDDGTLSASVGASGDIQYFLVHEQGTITPISSEAMAVSSLRRAIVQGARAEQMIDERDALVALGRPEIDAAADHATEAYREQQPGDELVEELIKDVQRAGATGAESEQWEVSSSLDGGAQQPQPGMPAPAGPQDAGSLEPAPTPAGDERIQPQTDVLDREALMNPGGLP